MDKLQAKAFFAREFHSILNRAMTYGRDPYLSGRQVSVFIEAELRKVPGKMLERMEADEVREVAEKDPTHLFVFPSAAPVV